MFIVKLVLVVFTGSFVFARAERCFHCTDVSDPSNCTTVNVCGPDQDCFIRQYVKTDGRVLYSSGCLEKTKCGTVGSVLGKRDLSRRDTDVTTCYECCDQDFCNNQGCNTKTVSRDQRGPYCFTCDASMDPNACNDVTVCKDTEECVVYASPELSTPSQIVYKSMCESKAACTAFSHISAHGNCPPLCCDQDFCNDQCSVKTTHPAVVCNTLAGYQLLQDANGRTPLCIQIHSHSQDWDDARATCIAAGGDLVVLDTIEKAAVMRSTIENDKKYNDKSGYWIGARDFHLTNIFAWVNNNTVSGGDWHAGQPNHHDGGHDQNCAAMWSRIEHYQWHDDYCLKTLPFICQQS